MAAEEEEGRASWWKEWGAPLANGELSRGGAGPLGGGGGVGVAREPNGGAGGGIERFCWLEKGEGIGAAEGVLLLAMGGLVTIGVSFHCPTSFARGGGGADEVLVLGGGAPKDGGGAP